MIIARLSSTVPPARNQRVNLKGSLVVESPNEFPCVNKKMSLSRTFNVFQLATEASISLKTATIDEASYWA